MLRSTIDSSTPTIQFQAEVVVNAEAEVVFAFISDHRRLPTWITGLKRVDVDESESLSPGGVGTRRTLYPIAGPSGVEVIVEFEPPHSMVYCATDASLRGMLTQHRSEISCEPTAAGTRIRWIVRGVASQSWWKRLLAGLVFSRAQRSGLAKLRRLLAS